MTTLTQQIKTLERLNASPVVIAWVRANPRAPTTGARWEQTSASDMLYVAAAVGLDVDSVAVRCAAAQQQTLSPDAFNAWSAVEVWQDAQTAINVRAEIPWSAVEAALNARKSGGEP